MNSVLISCDTCTVSKAFPFICTLYKATDIQFDSFVCVDLLPMQLGREIHPLV